MPSSKDTHAAKMDSVLSSDGVCVCSGCFGSLACHRCIILCVCLQAGEQMGIPLTQQASNESRLSMSESVSEFFDAQEVLLSASSSENEV